MESRYHTLDETALVSLLKSDDERAFKAIYDRFKARITTNLFTILKDRDLVEDTLQELFFRLWEKRDQIDPAQPIQGFLFRIATNLAHDHFRRLARDERVAAAFWDTVMAGTGATGSNYPTELDETLYRVIDMLPPQRRRVFLLCKFESKTYEEVSKLLGISVPAVNDHITKANKFLKAHFPRHAHIVACLLAAHMLEGIV